MGGLFIKHGLKLNLVKAEVLHIGHQREELDIELEGKKLNQLDSFVYLYIYIYGRGSVRRREDEERGTPKSAGRSERTESSWGGDGGQQLGPKNNKSKEGRQAKNCGVKGRDGSADELDRETSWWGAD